MKLLKCTFRSPLNGSICCEELLSDTDGRVELNSEQMATLYHRNYELKEFLEKNKEDLTFALPDDIKDFVFKAEIGDHTMYEGNLYLLTHVWVDGNDFEGGRRLKIQDWITGQLSDGWGESLEQREWTEDSVLARSTYFDKYDLNFDFSEEYYKAYYYVNPWVSHEFYVELVNCEEDELDIMSEEPVVYKASCQLLDNGTYATRTVYQFYEPDNVVTFIKNSGNTYSDFVTRWIEERGGFGCAIKCYVLHVNEGTFSQFLPVFGVVDMDLHSAHLYTLNAEEGTMVMEAFTEEEYSEFFTKLINS